MKLCPEILSKLCTISAENRYGPEFVARAAGEIISRPSLYGWLKKSREAVTDEEREPYMHRWPDEDSEPAMFHENWKLSQKMAQANLRLTILDLATHPQKFPRSFQGRTVYRISQDWIKAGGEDDPKLCELLGIPKYETDPETGELVPEMETTAINAQLLIAAARAFDKKFAEESTQNVNVRGGVMVVGAQAPPPKQVATYDITPKAIEHRPAEPLAELDTVALQDQVDLAELDGELAQELERPDVAALRRAAQALTQRGPAHPRPMAAAAARRPMPPMPQPITTRYQTEDDRMEGVGPGTPRPGGVRIA